MNLWQCAVLTLYLLGGVLMMRLIYTADDCMTYKSNGYEKVFCYVSWPLLAIGCDLVLASSWLKERDQ